MRKSIKIKQRDSTDCGAACLASVAAHYKMLVPVSRIRQDAGTDSRGTNILGLIEAAEKLGFEAKGAKGNPDSLVKIPLPAIAHLVLKNQWQHYVVIYEVRRGYLLMMDPADGRIHKKAIGDFKQEWSGIILLLLPGEKFLPGQGAQSNLQRFWLLVKPHRYMMLQAAIGALVYAGLGLTFSVYLQKIVDFVLVEGNGRLLNLLSGIMLVLLVCQLLIGYYKSLFALQTGQHIDARLILGYHSHLLQLPQRFFDTMRVGEIISRVNDAVKIRNFVNDVALNLLVNILIIAFSMACMFLYYWKLALIILALVPVYILLYQINNRINRKWQRRLMEEAAELESQWVEGLRAAGTIKRLGLENDARVKTENRFIILLKSVYRASVYGLYIANASEFVTRLFTIILLWAGSYFVINRELSPGELLSFYALIGYFTGPATALIQSNKTVQDALIAADRLFEIIDLEIEHTGEHEIELTAMGMGDIEFNQVSFRYGTRERVFDGLSLRIAKGKATAIVGESGSGKSTLLSLLQQIYPVDQGSITVGGIDLRHISKTSLRRMVGVVPQTIDLFRGSIAENIAIGDEEPDMKKILQVSALTGIDAFIDKFPASYSTLLQEQGINLSGGQRQRLAIARALYRDPQLLLLDEATSNLDPVSAEKIQEALDWFKAQGRTLVIIAHRLSTVRKCDRILVLHAGRLAEEGEHAELMERGGHYAGLWTSQRND